MKAVIKNRNDPVFARKFVTWGVMISSVMVFVSVFVAVYFNPEAVVKRTFEKLATDYYENYYYEKFFESMTDEAKAEKLETYTKVGLQPVLLRQLLLYQNGKNSKYKSVFESESYICDKNSTSAKFFPIPPYGPKDYTVEYNYSCVSEWYLV